MKKTILLSAIFISFFAVLNAQIDTKKINVYSDEKIFSDESLDINAQNPVSKFNYTKFALEIKNKSKDYYLFKTQETKFTFSFGNFSPEKEVIIIPPFKIRKETLKVDGDSKFLENSFEFDANGFYKFSEKDNVVEAPEFNIPINKNEFSFGNFTVQLKEVSLTTKESAFKFNVKYKGEKVAFLRYSQAVLIPEGGSEWATLKRYKNPTILQKGEDDSFILVFRIPGKVADMQFAKMKINWKDVFSEPDLEKVNITDKTKFELNEELTKQKNK